jgi:hypothetical protein
MVVSFRYSSLAPEALQKVRLPTGCNKIRKTAENSLPVAIRNKHWSNRLRRSKAAAGIYLLRVRTGKQTPLHKKAAAKHCSKKLRLWLITGQWSRLPTHFGTLA